jgi:adenosylcobinamide-phosphate synthase
MNDFFEFFAGLHAQIFDPDRLPVAALALFIVSFGGVVFGALNGMATPLFWRAVDFLFGKAGDKLDNTDRSPKDLVTRGFIITLTALIMAFLVGSFFQALSQHYPTFRVVDIAVLVLIMASGAGWRSLLTLYRAIEGKKTVKGAFYAIAATTRTNLTTADEYTLTRVGLGMAARMLDKGIVAPVLWYLIGGLPAAILQSCLSALAWRFGKDGFTKGFGASALALEKLMGFVPNLFSGVLVSLGGLLTPTAGMTRSFVGLFHIFSGNAAYAEGGAPVTAMAWALKVALGGPVQDVGGSALQRGWAGPVGATAKLEVKHLHRGLYIIVMAHLLLLAALLVGILLAR